MHRAPSGYEIDAAREHEIAELPRVDLVVAFAPLVLLVVLLGVVALVRVQHAAAVSREIVESTDPALRRVGAACVVFTLGVAGVLWARGVELPAAVAAAMITGLGALLLSAGVFGLQGLLIETDSERGRRQATGSPIASSRLGRIVAIALGLVPFVGWVAWSLALP